VGQLAKGFIIKYLVKPRTLKQKAKKFIRWRKGKSMAAISIITNSLKTAADITKAMIGLRDTSTIQAKVIELQGVILSAQHGALTTQTNQFVLLSA
jgi:hypothetical protein